MLEKNSEMLEFFEKLCFSFSSMVLNFTQKVWNCSYEHIKTQFWHACRKTLAKSHKLVARCPKGMKDFHKKSKKFGRVSKIGKNISFSEKIPFLSRYSFGHAECNFDISAEKLLPGGKTFSCSLAGEDSRNFYKIFHSFCSLMFLKFTQKVSNCLCGPIGNNSDIPAEKLLTGGSTIFCSLSENDSKILEFQIVLTFSNRHLQCNSDIPAEKPLTGGWIYFFSIYENFQIFWNFFSICFSIFLKITQTVSNSLNGYIECSFNLGAEKFWSNSRNFLIMPNRFWT